MEEVKDKPKLYIAIKSFSYGRPHTEYIPLKGASTEHVDINPSEVKT